MSDPVKKEEHTVQKKDLQKLGEKVGLALENADNYLAVGEQIILDAKPALVKALALLLSTFNDVWSDLELQLEKSSLLGAKALHRDYDNYILAGFSEDQAFQLVLASIKPLNFVELAKSVGQGASASTGKQSKKQSEKQ